jgi:hypothetical protein
VDAQIPAIFGEALNSEHINRGAHQVAKGDQQEISSDLAGPLPMATRIGPPSHPGNVALKASGVARGKLNPQVADK